MRKVADIEEAVAQLPPEELAAFRSWFERFEAERFGTRIEGDALGGRLDRFAEEALAERRSGTVGEL
jgi:hypothetical protein